MSDNAARVEDWTDREVTVVFKEVPPDLDIQIHKYHGTMLARDGNMVLFKFPTARSQVWVNLWSISSITYREP